eukprot:2399061-Pyramimonas_sp.AAC.1
MDSFNGAVEDEECLSEQRIVPPGGIGNMVRRTMYPCSSQPVNQSTSHLVAHPRGASIDTVESSNTCGR